MKTIAFIKSLTVAVAAVFVASCQQYAIDTQPSGEPKLATDALSSYTFAAENPQPASFNVTATTPWTIAGFESVEWCSVTPAASALSSLSEDVVISVAENTELVDRSVVLTLSAEDIDSTWTITVTQNRKGMLDVQPINGTFKMTGGALPFTVKTNLAWEVRSDVAWLTFDKTSGAGTGSAETVVATASANQSVARTGNVIVTAGDETYKFEVNQEGLSFDLEFVNVENPVLNSLGEEVVLEVNASMNWTASASDEWLTVEKLNDTQVKVTAPFNNKFAPRTASVILTASDPVYGGLNVAQEFTQDINFTFSGTCTVNADGSVLVSGDGNGQIQVVPRLKHFSVVMEISDLTWSSNGQLWFLTTEGGDFGNWMVQGKMRLRDYHWQSSNVYYDDKVNEDLLKSMTTYEFAYEPERLYFGINGTEIAHYDMPECWFNDERPDLGGWWIGFHKDVAGTGCSYVIKSCTITPIAEE